MSLATANATPDVSVLVPAKDEAENLPEFVRLCRDAFLSLPYACEVVVIDDGSTDATPAVLRDLVQKHAFVRSVNHPCSCSIPPISNTCRPTSRRS